MTTRKKFNNNPLTCPGQFDTRRKYVPATDYRCPLSDDGKYCPSGTVANGLLWDRKDNACCYLFGCSDGYIDHCYKQFDDSKMDFTQQLRCCFGQDSQFSDECSSNQYCYNKDNEDNIQMSEQCQNIVKTYCSDTEKVAIDFTKEGNPPMEDGTKRINSTECIDLRQDGFDELTQNLTSYCTSDRGTMNEMGCIKFCNEYPEKCTDEYKKYCSKIYEEAKSNKQIDDKFLRNNNNICGCYWPQEFYDNIIEKLGDEYQVPKVILQNLAGNPPCLYSSCVSSATKPKNYDNVDCPDINFSKCIQNINVDNSGNINKLDINSKIANCSEYVKKGATDPDSKPDPKPGPGLPDPDPVDDGGSMSILGSTAGVITSIVIIVISLIVLGFVIFKKK